MLRKKKSLVDRAVDSASDAVDAALPVIENAVTQVREQVPRPEQGDQDQGRSTDRRDQGAGR